MLFKIGRISNRDLILGYLAQFLSMANGLILLPFILGMLTADEVGIYYIFLTIGSLVVLSDFGFSGQISRSVSYVLSGADSLQKEGIEISKSNSINFSLLSSLVSSAKYIFFRLAILIFFLVGTFGTLYLYYVTDGLSSVSNLTLIWLVFSVGVFLNVYYTYLSSLLHGKGMVTKSNLSVIYSKALNIVLTMIFLFAGLRLLGVVLANLISPFLSRYLANSWFFTEDFRKGLRDYRGKNLRNAEVLEILWYNSRKFGLVALGSFTINKFSVFLVAIYLGLSEVGAYGLMLQVYGVLATVGSVLVTMSLPRFSSLRVQGEKDLLIREFALSSTFYYLTYFIGAILLMTFLYDILDYFGSNVSIPSVEIMILFGVVVFLEGNHTNFATLIVSSNKVPFVKSALIAGSIIVLLDVFVLEFTSLGLFGLVLVQGSVQLVYANWKWPKVVLNEFGISVYLFFKLCVRELVLLTKSGYNISRI